MRITIVQGAFLPVPPVMGGAVEKIWFDLGKEFARRGHEVVHISKQHPALPAEEKLDGVRHIRIKGFDIPQSMLRLKWRDLLYSRRASNVLPLSDVIVTNTFWLPILAPQAKRRKLYVHVARYPKGQMKFYGKAARLQTVSTVVGDAISKEVPGLAAKVRVIPNFIPEVQSSGDEVRGKYILYAGRVHPEKGLGLLLDAFARVLQSEFSDWKLRVVGPWQSNLGGGGETYIRSLRQKSQAIQDHVEWIEPVFDVNQLNAHYRAASFFVYPSLAAKGESFGLAPLEAMASGCPPLVSALECFRDFLVPGENGWSFNHNASDCVGTLTRALLDVVSVSQSLAKFRKSAIETARQFTLSKVADRYLQDFEEVVSA